MADVQIAVIDQQDTQIALAVPGVQGPPGAAGAAGPAGIPVVASGTEAAPAISFVSDPDTGINNNGPNQLALVTGGQNALLVDASGVTAVGGDLTLSDGGTYTTTLQTITPTAARTISFPDATGTVGLVGGSSGNLVVNQSGAYAGVANSSVDNATGNITLGSRFISTVASASSAPAAYISGTWFAGAAATALPALYVSPAGTSAGTSWSTSGTGFGVNAASGFGGNLLDLQVNGTSLLNMTTSGGSGGQIFRVQGVSGASYTEILARFTAGGHTQFAVMGSGNQRGAFVGAGCGYGWSNASGVGTTVDSVDLYLYRDAAGTLAQRNGATAQTFRVYNTFTDASNYERGFLRWSSDVFEVGPEAAGTGTARPMRITAATLKLPNLPTYADNTAALAGSLVAGDVYKTATGELRITV
jgi:hypothetical protein